MWGHVCRWNGPWEKEVGYTGTFGNNDCQLAFRIVLNDFKDDALTISKWDSTYAECLLATAGVTVLLVELIGVAA